MNLLNQKLASVKIINGIKWNKINVLSVASSEETDAEPVKLLYHKINTKRH